MAAKAAQHARRQAEKEAADTCNSHERVPGRRLSVFAKRKVQAPEAATMPAPPTDDVVPDHRSRRASASGLVDALRHKLIRQAAQVAPHHRQTAQGQAVFGPAR